MRRIIRREVCELIWGAGYRVHAAGWRGMLETIQRNTFTRWRYFVAVGAEAFWP